jgi:Zn-dependent protease with chaperone function
MEDIYPQGPAGVPRHFARPGPSYRRHAWLAMAGLALFVLAYGALAGWFVWIGLHTIGRATAGDAGFMAVVAGGCAWFLAAFMLKSLFFVRKGSGSDGIEIKRAEQPRLFAFLDRLADEAGAPRPRRVFLSGAVNAAVFYDLSLLNLLFPSRKNLDIGLGLVNVLSLGEFKAVCAHEFGHFAQRSMAVGRWVYTAQQVAAHIVATRGVLDKFLDGLSRLDLRIAWIGFLLRRSCGRCARWSTVSSGWC